MGNSVKVSLINSAGNIVVQEAGVGVVSNLRSSMQVVAVYVTYEDSPGNEVTLRHKGVDAIACEVTADAETCIYERILSGSGKGANVRTYKAIGSPSTRTIESGTEDVVGSAEICWDVYEGGTGGTYNSALAAADAAVGY